MTQEITTLAEAITALRNHLAAAQAHEELLMQCQEENKRLAAGLRYYADAEIWAAGMVQKLALTDRGEIARKILGGDK